MLLPRRKQKTAIHKQVAERRTERTFQMIESIPFMPRFSKHETVFFSSSLWSHNQISLTKSRLRVRPEPPLYLPLLLRGRQRGGRFRVALANACFPGMTSCSEPHKHDANCRARCWSRT